MALPTTVPCPVRTFLPHERFACAPAPYRRSPSPAPPRSIVVDRMSKVDSRPPNAADGRCQIRAAGASLRTPTRTPHQIRAAGASLRTHGAGNPTGLAPGALKCNAIRYSPCFASLASPAGARILSLLERESFLAPLPVSRKDARRSFPTALASPARGSSSSPELRGLCAARVPAPVLRRPAARAGFPPTGQSLRADPDVASA